MARASESAVIRRLQARLQRAASADLKAWWERYIKHDTVFRGVALPKIRDLVREWRGDHDLSAWPLLDQIDLAFSLIAEPLSEDKLAGVIYLQEYLLADSEWGPIVARSEQAFAHGHVFDWNVCDWACVRVWGPLMQRHGAQCIRAIAAWSASAHLWQARAGVVSFVPLIRKNSPPSAGTRALIFRGCRRLIRRPERFAKTAVGWVLRDFSAVDAAPVRDFVARHGAFFTNEVFQNATKKMSRVERERLRESIGKVSKRST